MKLTLFVNHRCNLRCSYCYTGEKFNRPMSLDVAKRAIDFGYEQADAHRATDGGALVLSFFGGEPLLELDLIEQTLEYAAEQARARDDTYLYLSVATNGTAFSERCLELLRRYRFQVQVSLDGCPAAQDATRRFADGRSSAALVESNVRRLLDEGFKLRIVSVIDPANVDHLGESFDYLMDLGVRYIHFSPNYTGAWDDAACERFERALEDLGHRYMARLRAAEDVRLDPLNGKIVTHLNKGYQEKNLCQFGQKEMAVSPSGNLYPCDRLVGEDDNEAIRIGDIYQGLDEVKRDAMVVGKNEPDPECKECELQRRCMHWCGCANFETTGKVTEVSPIVCWFERCLIAEADRVANTLFAEKDPVFLRRFYVPEAPLPDKAS